MLVNVLLVLLITAAFFGALSVAFIAGVFVAVAWAREEFGA
jgi:hypothetical protein